MFKRKLKNVYIGETKRMLKFRKDDHCGYINNFIDKATGTHFTLQGQSLANQRVTAIEQIKKTNSNEYRKESEEYFIGSSIQ